MEMEHKLPRVLEYRKAIRMKWLAIKVLILFVFISFFVSLIFGFSSGAFSSGFFFLVLLAEYYFIIRPKEKFKIQVFDDHFRIHSGPKDISINFQDIEKVEHLGKISSSDSFQVTLKDSRTFSFNGLARSEYLLEAIVARNKELMDAETFQAFRSKLLISDHGFARFDQLSQKQPQIVLAIIFGLLPLGYFVLIYLLQSQTVVIWNFSSYLFWTITLLYTLLLVCGGIGYFYVSYTVDKVVKRRLQESPDNKLRDLTLEQTLYKKALKVYLATIALLFFFVYFFSLNMVSGANETINGVSTHFWIDGRFNCISTAIPNYVPCIFGLRRGDRIQFHSETLVSGRTAFVGEITAVPGDRTRVNTGSLQEITLPEGFVAVQIGDISPVPVQVAAQEIQGKAFDGILSYLFR